MNYSEKLKDPRWQKKRLEILVRDSWTCQRCDDKTSTLVVHHRDYLKDKDPWDYPNELLITLCEHCHQEQLDRNQIEQSLIHEMRRLFLTDELFIIADGFRQIPSGYSTMELWDIAESVRDTAFIFRR